MTVLKSQANEQIPTGDEMASVCCKEEAMTLKEWCEFMGPPDILLEKEMCWPVEEDMKY